MWPYGSAAHGNDPVFATLAKNRIDDLRRTQQAVAEQEDASAIRVAGLQVLGP